MVPQKFVVICGVRGWISMLMPTRAWFTILGEKICVSASPYTCDRWFTLQPNNGRFLGWHSEFDGSNEGSLK